MSQTQTNSTPQIQKSDEDNIQLLTTSSQPNTRKKGLCVQSESIHVKERHVFPKVVHPPPNPPLSQIPTSSSSPSSLVSPSSPPSSPSYPLAQCDNPSQSPFQQSSSSLDSTAPILHPQQNDCLQPPSSQVAQQNQHFPHVDPIQVQSSDPVGLIADDMNPSIDPSPKNRVYPPTDPQLLAPETPKTLSQGNSENSQHQYFSPNRQSVPQSSYFQPASWGVTNPHFRVKSTQEQQQEQPQNRSLFTKTDETTNNDQMDIDDTDDAEDFDFNWNPIIGTGKSPIKIFKRKLRANRDNIIVIVLLMILAIEVFNLCFKRTKIITKS